MAKTVNLTVRVSPTLKAEAEAAAEYLDTNISKLVRDAFRDAIELAKAKRLKAEHFRSKFAEFGVDGFPAVHEERQSLSLKARSIAGFRRAAAQGLITPEEAERHIAALGD